MWKGITPLIKLLSLQDQADTSEGAHGWDAHAPALNNLTITGVRFAKSNPPKSSPATLSFGDRMGHEQESQQSEHIEKYLPKLPVNTNSKTGDISHC